LGRMPRVN